MNSPLKNNLEKLECHFTWDLGQHQNELKGVKRKMQNVDKETCTWLVHYYNLLGFIQRSLGSNTEALMYLHKAESVIQEQGTEEAGVCLQVNKANLAWAYFHLGEMEKSKAYLEEVKRLQGIHPAPPGCSLHPEVSGEKGWTLVKFNRSEKRKAVDYFKMALKAEPERKEWHKGLAIAMSTAFTMSERTSELKADILEHVKTAAEVSPNDLFLQSLYVVMKSETQAENNDEEVQNLLERFLSAGNLDGIGFILEYFNRISFDRAIHEGQRLRERFPTSPRVARLLAKVYKWKVFSIKEDSQERQIWAQRSIELLEEVVKHYPDCFKGWIDLAALYCYTHNLERSDEIYQQLLSQEDDLPPHTQQLLYYSYACHLFHHRKSRDKSIDFLMKAAAIQNISNDREKSISILKKTVENGRSRRCEEISKFLKTVLKDD